MKLTPEQKWEIAAGVLMGATGSLLVLLGNPANTGICVSCFMENSVGALGLHPDERMRYMRPELLGFFLGSFIIAVGSKEFRPRAGSSGISGFGLGLMMIVGSAVFLGCPIKALLRLAAGDMTAVAGVAGLIAGVWAGLKTLATSDPGFEGTTQKSSEPVAYGIALLVTVLAALVFVPGVYLVSRGGGGSLHAPAVISLAAGIGLGVLCQRSRFCITGSIRDLLLTRRGSMGLGLAGAFLTAVVLNVFTGQFNPGYVDQPGAHLEWLWNFAGLGLVGWSAVVAGGCPFRQIIKAGEGDLDAATICAGMILGAVLVKTWGIGATSAGVPPQAKAAVLVGLAALLALSLRRKGVRG